MLKRFVSACDAIAEWSGRILSIGEYVIMIVMLWQVSARYIFKNPAVWTSDISLYVFGALGVLSGAYLLKHHEHIKVDLFYAQYPPRVKAVVDIVIYLIVIAWCVILCYFSIPYVIQTIQTGERGISSLHAPLWPIRMTIPIAGILQGLEALALLIRSAYFAIKGEEL